MPKGIWSKRPPIFRLVRCATNGNRREWPNLYGFTQKERDTETGLTYFGKRFYSSALGKWLSTDPLEEKGGSLNLYGYVNQNPFKYHDPDGGEVTMTRTVTGKGKNAETHYEIHVTAVVINLSTELKEAGWGRKELEAFKDKIKQTIEASYSGKEGKTTWKTTVDIKVIDSMDEIKEASGDYKGDHVFRLVNQIYFDGWGPTRGLAATGGKWMEIRAGLLLKPARPGAEDYLSPEGTAGHEYGHSGGLPHAADDDPNLMQPGHARSKDNRTITSKQIGKMSDGSKAGHLNQGSSKMGSWEAAHKGLKLSD